MTGERTAALLAAPCSIATLAWVAQTVAAVAARATPDAEPGTETAVETASAGSDREPEGVRPDARPDAQVSFVVRPSDNCPSGIATAVRMAPSHRVHALFASVGGGPTLGHMPACGSHMGTRRSVIVLTDAKVNCPRCLSGDTIPTD